MSGISIQPPRDRLDKVLTEEEIKTNGYILSTFGIIILGILGTCLSIGLIEYNYPDTFKNFPVIGSFIDYLKDIYNIWSSKVPVIKPDINTSNNPPNTPVQTPGQELSNNFNFLPFSRSSSQDTITAFDDSVLDTPRTRIW